MHFNSDNPDLILAVQVMVISAWSGLVAWANRIACNKAIHWSIRQILISAIIDIFTSSLVGFSVFLLAQHYQWSLYDSLLSAIVAGHYGARWFGALTHHASPIIQTVANQAEAESDDHKRKED